MIVNIIRAVMVVSTSWVGYLIAPYLFPNSPSAPFWGLGIGLVLGVIILILEISLARFSGKALTAGIMGLILGLIAANLVAPAIVSVVRASWYVHVLLLIIFSYLGIVLSVRKMEDLPFLVNLLQIKDKKAPDFKILDTSVIIDGRIADIQETGFLEGTLIIPRFVLKELQQIADSSDTLKRNRGRRGLDILNRLQKKAGVKVEIQDRDFPELREVDAKLVKLGEQLKAKVVTNDYNLNKVAELQGVEVLNVNDLANAVKPVVLPGELMNVRVLKEGKEYGQGVGYLDDGTMVVVDNGRSRIGQAVDVLVTSVLQTTAGRMIFTRLKEEVDREQAGF